jgi:spore coat polysaccharide biosynthesis predicted glycosyltransferase SpsG
MIAICLESSHQKGMGHLFRSLHLSSFLKSQGQTSMIFLNNHEPALEILRNQHQDFQIINLNDVTSDWETKMIRQFGIRLWINDRLDTEERHAEFVKKNKIPLLTFDDRGGGAALADVHFAALVFNQKEKLKGHRVLAGLNYLILNPEITQYRRLRENKEKLLVSLGGSDTYGVSLKILKYLRQLRVLATIHVGPSFAQHRALREFAGREYPVISNVPSLIRVFAGYDLVFSGGGITPYEANAMGLPCLMVSCEDHERPSCEFLQQLGSSFYLGKCEKLSAARITEALRQSHVSEMSKAGLEKIPVEGLQNIREVIKEFLP